MRNIEDSGDGRAMPENNEISSSKDYVVSEFDAYAPIDYETLKAEIDKNGPLQVVYPDINIKYRLNISLCNYCEDVCQHDCISLTQISGFTTLTTSINKDKLLECCSFIDFLEKFISSPISFYSSSAEQQHIEGEIERHLGFAPMDYYSGKIDPEKLEQEIKLSEEAQNDLWLRNNLLQSLLHLKLHRDIINSHSQEGFKELLDQQFSTRQEFREFLRFLYDLGFYSGRTVSEYFYRVELEPITIKGAETAKNYKKRGSNSGSDRRRSERLDTFMRMIESTYEENPAIRTYEEMVLRAAFDLAIPKGQYGHGQYESYATEIRSVEPYKTRFDRLFRKVT